jgi:hypothetical protein
MYISREPPISSAPIYYRRFPRIAPAPADRRPSFLDALAGVLLLGLGVWTVGTLLQEPNPRRRPRRYNDAPLPYEDKEYVSRRDGWRCTFCGKRVSRGTRHVDHSVSRANGGTNHLNNLRLACSACNLKKGPLNARQFLGI